MIILAVDPSTKSTGVALFEDGTLKSYECIQANNSNLFARIRDMISQFEEYIKQYQKIDKIVIEDVIPDDVQHNQTVFKALTYLQGFLLDLFNKYKIPHEFVTASSWRKKCGIQIGRGIKRDALKQQDIKFVKEHFQIDVNDDVADAICIGYGATQG